MIKYLTPNLISYIKASAKWLVVIAAIAASNWYSIVWVYWG